MYCPPYNGVLVGRGSSILHKRINIFELVVILIIYPDFINKNLLLLDVIVLFGRVVGNILKFIYGSRKYVVLPKLVLCWKEFCVLKKISTFTSR